MRFSLDVDIYPKLVKTVLRRYAERAHTFRATLIKEFCARIIEHEITERVIFFEDRKKIPCLNNLQTVWE